MTDSIGELCVRGPVLALPLGFSLINPNNNSCYDLWYVSWTLYVGAAIQLSNKCNRVPVRSCKSVANIAHNAY